MSAYISICMNRKEYGLVFASCALLCGKDEQGPLDPVSVGAVKNTEQKRVACEWKMLDVQGNTTVFPAVRELGKPRGCALPCSCCSQREFWTGSG